MVSETTIEPTSGLILQLVKLKAILIESARILALNW